MEHSSQTRLKSICPSASTPWRYRERIVLCASRPWICDTIRIAKRVLSEDLRNAMTPGITTAQRAKIAYTIHEYAHDASSESYGLEAAEKLGVPAERIFKTLVVSLDGRKLAVGIVPVQMTLNMKLLARAVGAKKASMAAKADVERSTGYVLGGVSPLGQKRRLPTVLDASALRYATIYVSAGRRGLEIELSPDDLAALIDGVFAEISQKA